MMAQGEFSSLQYEEAKEEEIGQLEIFFLVQYLKLMGEVNPLLDGRIAFLAAKLIPMSTPKVNEANTTPFTDSSTNGLHSTRISQSKYDSYLAKNYTYVALMLGHKFDVTPEVTTTQKLQNWKSGIDENITQEIKYHHKKLTSNYNLTASEAKNNNKVNSSILSTDSVTKEMKSLYEKPTANYHLMTSKDSLTKSNNKVNSSILSTDSVTKEMKLQYEESTPNYNLMASQETLKESNMKESTSTPLTNFGFNFKDLNVTLDTNNNFEVLIGLTRLDLSNKLYNNGNCTNLSCENESVNQSMNSVQSEMNITEISSASPIVLSHHGNNTSRPYSKSELFNQAVVGSGSLETNITDTSSYATVVSLNFQEEKQNLSPNIQSNTEKLDTKMFATAHPSVIFQDIKDTKQDKKINNASKLNTDFLNHRMAEDTATDDPILHSSLRKYIEDEINSSNIENNNSFTHDNNFTESSTIDVLNLFVNGTMESILREINESLPQENEIDFLQMETKVKVHLRNVFENHLEVTALNPSHLSSEWYADLQAHFDKNPSETKNVTHMNNSEEVYSQKSNLSENVEESSGVSNALNKQDKTVNSQMSDLSENVEESSGVLNSLNKEGKTVNSQKSDLSENVEESSGVSSALNKQGKAVYSQKSDLSQNVEGSSGVSNSLNKEGKAGVTEALDDGLVSEKEPSHLQHIPLSRTSFDFQEAAESFKQMLVNVIAKAILGVAKKELLYRPVGKDAPQNTTKEHVVKKQLESRIEENVIVQNAEKVSPFTSSWFSGETFTERNDTENITQIFHLPNDVQHDQGRNTSTNAVDNTTDVEIFDLEWQL